MFRFSCPYCNASIRAKESQCGSFTRCPKCREPWRVPTEPGGEVDTNPLAGVEEDEPAAEHEAAPPEAIHQPAAEWQEPQVYSPTYDYPPPRSFGGVIGWAVAVSLLGAVAALAALLVFRPSDRQVAHQGKPGIDVPRQAQRDLIRHPFWDGSPNIEPIIDELTAHGEGYVFVNSKGQSAWSMGPSDPHPLIVHVVCGRTSPAVAALGERRVFVAITLMQGQRLTRDQARNALIDALNRKSYAQLRKDSEKQVEDLLNMKPIDFGKN